MARLTLTTSSGTREIPATSTVLVGSDPLACSWVVRASPSYTQLPPLWVELRWDGVGDTWRSRQWHPKPEAHRGYWDGFHPVRSGACWVDGDRSLTLVDASPPHAFALCLADGRIADGDALHELVGTGMLRGLPQRALVQVGRHTWRVYVPSAEPRPPLSVGRTRIRVTLDAAWPTLEVWSMGETARIEGRLVWSVLPYIRERLAGTGWLSARTARRYYADELGVNEETVRANRLSEDRSQVDQRLRRAGLLNCGSLFEVRLAGRDTTVRLAVDPVDIALVERSSGFPAPS